MIEDAYVVGTKPVPNWCRDKILPFLRADGTIGYEFSDGVKIHNLSKGDILIKHIFKITVKKAEEQDGEKE